MRSLAVQVKAGLFLSWLIISVYLFSGSDIISVFNGLTALFLSMYIEGLSREMKIYYLKIFPVMALFSLPLVFNSAETFLSMEADSNGLNQYIALNMGLFYTFSITRMLLALSPVEEIIHLPGRGRITVKIRSILFLSFRLIMLYSDSLHQFYRAVSARPGNPSFFRRMRNYSATGLSFILRVFQRTERLTYALASRNFAGKFYIKEGNKNYPIRNIVIIVLYLSYLLILIYIKFGLNDDTFFK